MIDGGLVDRLSSCGEDTRQIVERVVYRSAVDSEERDIHQYRREEDRGDVPRDLKDVPPPAELDYGVGVRVSTHSSLVSSFSCLFVDIESQSYVSESSSQPSLSLGYS